MTDEWNADHIQKKLLSVLRIMALMTILLAAYSVSTSRGSPKPMNEQDWRIQIAQVAFPKDGCFKATYPSKQWQEVACTTPSNLHPMAHADVGGGSQGAFAQVTGHIDSATGSFPVVTGVTSVTSLNTPDLYTLQLNTGFFKTTSFGCMTINNPSCRGWQQFIFSNNAGPNTMSTVAIEYWLLHYHSRCAPVLPTPLEPPCTCPSHAWTSLRDGFGNDCTMFSPTLQVVQDQPITNLASLSLTGEMITGGQTTGMITVMGNTVTGINQPDILNLRLAWQGVEFNIFGSCCGAQAQFNPGSTINVKTTLSGPIGTLSCVNGSTTSETNNLTLVGTPVLTATSIEATESNNPGGSPFSC